MVLHEKTHQKENVIEMFSSGPHVHAQNGPLMDLFGKGPKNICMESSNGEPKK